MESYAIVNYNSMELVLFFKDERIIFDLKEGDIGNFFYGFVTSDGKEYDLHFQKDEGSEDLSVYETYLSEGYYVTDSNNYHTIPIKETIGDPLIYLKINP